MVFVIAAIASVFAFIYVYPSVLAWASFILAKKTSLNWWIKSLAHLAAIFCAIGVGKLFSHVLSVLILGLNIDLEQFVRSMVLMIVFPSLIVVTSVLAITLFHRVKHQLPKSANEELYLTYLLEAQGSERRESLWAKCLVEANGDEMKAQTNYVKARIKEGDKSFISQGTANVDHVTIDDDSLNLKVHKKRIFILLALTIVASIYYATRTNLTFLGPHTSSSKDNSTVVGIYELQDCQKCLAGSCKAEGPNKIIIDFSKAVGFTKGNFISDKGELFSEVRSTDWRGCKYDPDSLSSIAKCKENYETDSDIFQTYRFLSSNLYTFEKSTTSKVSNGITFETLTCKVKPTSFP